MEELEKELEEWKKAYEYQCKVNNELIDSRKQREMIINLMINEIMSIRLNDKFGFFENKTIVDKANSIREYYEHLANKLKS
jgi:hypothetical protein